MKDARITPIRLGISTAFLVQGDCPILIDTGIPGKEDRIKEELSRAGVEIKDISLILLTHAHFDHMGSASKLKELTDAPVAIHQLEADYPRAGTTPSPKPSRMMGWLLKPLIKLTGSAGIPPFEPDILVEDEMDLEPYGLNGRVIHTPRHSIGSVSVVLDNGDAIVGDLIMGRSSPNWPYFADDLVKESIRLITGLSTGSIYCAHTGPFDVKDVKYRFF